MVTKTANPLADLKSRPEILALLRDEVDQAMQSGRSLALAILNIDYTAELNERLGISAANLAVQAVMVRVGESLDPGWILGHHGGDQLVLLLPGLEAEEALLAVERLRATVAATQISNQTAALATGDAVMASLEGLTCTVSIGLASAPKHGRDADTLLRRALGALYRAKHLGRNRVVFPSEERMVTKTSHYSTPALEQLKALARRQGRGEAELLREALDDVILKYKEPPTQRDDPL